MVKLVLLKSEQDFKNFKASKSFQGKVLKIRVHFSANQNLPRFGFIVPKRVLPSVVDRNKVKRRLKSLLQTHLAKIRPADIIFYPTKNALKLKVVELGQELELIFTNARLWKS